MSAITTKLSVYARLKCIPEELETKRKNERKRARERERRGGWGGGGENNVLQLQIVTIWLVSIRIANDMFVIYHYVHYHNILLYFVSILLESNVDLPFTY